MEPLLVVAGGTYQLPLLHAARHRGLATVLLDGDPGAPGFCHADSGEVVDIADPEAVIALARRIRPCGIASIVSEVAVASVAAAAEALGLPGLETSVAAACTDKFVMRSRFERAGLRCPRFAIVDAPRAALPVAEGIGFPLIVKPVDSSGSRGVRRVDRPGELADAVSDALAWSRKKRAIVEGFLDGNEFTVETFTVNGQTEVLGMSEKTRLPFPHCVSVDLTYFPYLGLERADAIAATARQAIAAVGLRNGPGHVEVMLTAEGPVAVELAARGGGYRIFSDIVPAISGVNLVDAVIDLAIGRVPRVRPDFQRAAVLRFFNPPTTGILSSITGVQAAREMEGVLDVVIEAEIGRPFRGITRDGERPGYLIAVGESREAAVSAADRAAREVVFNIESEPIGVTGDEPASAPAAGMKGKSA